MKAFFAISLCLIYASLGFALEGHSAPKTSLTNIQVDPQKGLQTVATKTVHLGYGDIYEKLPHLSLKEIHQAEFERFKKAYRSDFDVNTSRVEFKPTTFSIATLQSRFTFKREPKNLNTAENRNGLAWAEYKGYFPTLKLYALIENSVSEGLDFGNYVLLSKEDGSVYYLIASGDGPAQASSLSPTNAYLAYYDNNYRGCLLAVIQVNGPAPQFKEYASVVLPQDQTIEDLVWADPNTLALKVQILQRPDLDASNELKYLTKYFKAKLP